MAYRPTAQGTRQRLVRRIEPAPTDPALPAVWQPGGLYLISGGLGGIGRRLAERLLRDYQARVLLTGRRPLAEDRLAWFEALRSQGQQVDYLAGDICDPQHVARLRHWIESQPIPLQAVLHTAGQLDLQRLALRTKTPESFAQVLAAKVAGSCLLWQALQPPRLVLFSSIGSLSAPLAAGQSDYAAANRFQRDLAQAFGAPAVQAVILSESGRVRRARAGPGRSDRTPARPGPLRESRPWPPWKRVWPSPPRSGCC